MQNGNNGSNPMCDFENYEEAVRMWLPQVVRLDGAKEVVPAKTRQVSRDGNPAKKENVNSSNIKQIFQQ